MNAIDMENLFKPLFGVIVGGILTLGIEAYILYRVRNNSKKDELKKALSSLIDSLNLAKAYWFLIIETNYLWKYEDAVQKVAQREGWSVSQQLQLQMEDSFRNFENYRLKMIEVNANVQSNLGIIKTIDKSLAELLVSRVEKLKLSGWKIPGNLAEVDVNSVRRGQMRHSISHQINQKLHSKGQIGHRVDVLVEQINSAMAII